MSKLMKFASKFVVAALALSFIGAASPAQAAQTGDLTVTVHYARQAGDFTGRYAWVWFTGTNASGTFTGTGVVTATGGAWVPVSNAGIDSYGAVSTFTLSGGKNIDRFGIIECSTNSWSTCVKDPASGSDRFITVSSLNTEVWLRSGSNLVADTTIYTSDSLSPNAVTSQTVKMHYNRPDGNYSGWKVHLGTESKIMASTYWVSPTDYDFTASNPVGYKVGTDAFGTYIEAELPYYAGQTKTINMVVYSLDANNVWVKDGGNADGNRYLAADASGTTNIWLVSGDTTGTGAFASEPVIASPSPSASTSSNPAPVISALDVTSASAGDSVTITGTDLQLDVTPPTVTVGGTSATVTASTASSVTFTVPEGLSAGDASVEVTTAGGTSNSATLTIVNNTTPSGPTIDSFAPAAAHRGDVVVINGSGLLDAVVTVSGLTDPLDALSGDTWVSFAIPSDLASGDYLVTVTTTAGSASAGYTVLPDGPTITSITDLQGSSVTQVQQGDVVVINGTGFTGVSSVSFAGQEADLTGADTVLTDTAITVAVPESISGAVTVTTPGGTATSDPLTFLNIAAPTIDAVDPASARAGDLVFIGGTHLLGSTVTIGGAAAANVVTTASLLTVTMPAGLAVGDAAVVVTTEGGSATSSITVLTSAPTISSVSVASANVGDVVTIYGADFAGVTEVSFNGVAADLTNPAFEVAADGTSLSVVVPDGAQSGTISVTTPNGTGSFDGFEIGYIEPPSSPAPVVASVSAPNAYVGDTVTITGSDFTGATEVAFGGVAADLTNPSFAVNSDGTEITVVVPDGAQSGTISVTTPHGTGLFYGFVIGDLTPSANPTFVLTDPQAVRAGDALTLLGQNLGNNPQVTIGGISATVIDCGSYAQDLDGIWGPDLNNCDGQTILILVPEGLAAGPQQVEVSWTNQISASISVNIVEEPPAIDSLSDQSGVVGDLITIFGSNFRDIVSVTFNGDGVSSPASVDLTDSSYLVNPEGTSVTVKVPAGATGGTITVATLSGYAESTDTFDILPIPTIDSISATSGIPGDTITIYGTNLDSILSVAFNGVEADLTDFNTVIAEDGSSVTVTVPDDATTGNITITTSGGTATSADIFSLASSPTIISLSSLMGRAGAILSITGTSLGGLTSVSFDGDEDGEPVLADLTNPLTSLTSSRVTVVVPEGVTSGSVTLTTAGGVVTSDDVYEIVSSPVVVSMSDTSLKPGSTITVTGSGLTWAKVRIRGVLASVLSGSTDTQLKVTVPQLAPGKTSMVITTPGGVVTQKVSISTPAPIIKSFTQSASKKRGVGTVVVTGRNLGGAVVKVGKFVAKVRPGSTATRLVFTLPKRAAATAKGVFSVTTDNGIAKSKAALKVTVK